MNKLKKWIFDHKKNALSIMFATSALLVVLILSISIKVINNSRKKTKVKVKSATVEVISGVKTPSLDENASIGQTVQWQKSLSSNITGSIDKGTVVEEIGQDQVFAGNVKLPLGWTIEYSTSARGTAESSRVFSFTEPLTLSDVTYLRITTGTTGSLKPNVQSSFVKPLEDQSLVESTRHPLPPILYNKKIFQIMRAVDVQDGVTDSTDYTFDCFDLDTYARCTGITYPTYFSTTTGALGTGTKNISTPVNLQTYIDTGAYGNAGRMYLPGQSGNNYGVVCVDLLLQTNCGFTILGASAAPSGANPALISGFVEKDGKLYGHANDADQTYQTVVCFDMNTDLPCSGYSSSTVVAGLRTYLISEHGNSYNSPGTHVMSGTKLFWLVNYHSGNTNIVNFFPPGNTQRDIGNKLTCYDTATKALCSDWPTFYGSTGGGETGGLGAERVNGLYLAKNSDGTDRAVCDVAGLGSGADMLTHCYLITTGALTTTQANLMPQASAWYGLYWTPSPYSTDIIGPDGHHKTYFPFYNTATVDLNAAPLKGATICYDWDAQAPCAEFSLPTFWHKINLGKSADTGYVYDGSCMWAMGYTGYIWSFNATTGETPCRTVRAQYTAQIDPDNYYCDGNTHAISWGKAKLGNASMYDFQKFTLTAKDTSSNQLGQSELRSIQDSGGNPVMDLGSISHSTYSSLVFDLDGTLYNTSPWGQGNTPYISVDANADDAQYCYDTTVAGVCDTTSIVTQSDAIITSSTDSPTDSNTATVNVTQAPEVQCFKDLSIDISTSNTSVKNGDPVTYTIQVNNKANTDAQGRGNIPSAYNSSLASIEATVPSGLTFQSASDGGVLSGDKVVWSNQSINAAANISRTVTFTTPGLIASARPKPDILLASISQSNIALQAQVIYSGDVFQSDNTSSNNTIIFLNNQPPTITNFVQSNTPLVAPANLAFYVNISDDDAIDTVQLLSGTTEVGYMLETSTPGRYALGYNGLAAGTYSFKVRAVDFGLPILTTNSGLLTVTVDPAPVAPPICTSNCDPAPTPNPVPTPVPITTPTPAPTPTPIETDIGLNPVNDDNGADQPSTQPAPSNLKKIYTPLAIRDSLPSPFVGTVEAAFKLADSVVKPVPPKVAKALPYGTILILIGIAAFYAYQAYSQVKTRRSIAMFAKRFKETDEKRKSYIDLTSHYINTPITIMQSSVELAEMNKSLPQKAILDLKNSIKKLADDARSSLNSSQLLVDEAKKNAKIFEIEKQRSLFSSPGFIVPVVGVMITAFVLNSLFILSNKYSSTILNTAMQSLLYILGAVSVAFAYKNFGRQKYATQVASQELSLEQSLSSSQSSFINQSSRALTKDLSLIKQSAQAMNDTEQSSTFNYGMQSIEKAVSKLTYLESLKLSNNSKDNISKSIDHILEQIAVDYNLIALHHRLNLIVASTPGLTTTTSEADLKQVVTSVLDNAIKFTNDGGTINLKYKVYRGNKILITIQDNGVGIPKDKVDKLFEPFARATDTRSFDYEGIGLDLYMDELIVEKNGGSINIQSVEGTGTTVNIMLPR